MNPETAVVDARGETRGVFRWADGSCMYFKPRVDGVSGGS
jgi:hypothetical protein